RLARYLDILPEQVVRNYAIPDLEDRENMLRHTKDGCVFLDGNLCMVYEARPRACRKFPYLTTHERSLAPGCRRSASVPGFALSSTIPSQPTRSWSATITLCIDAPANISTIRLLKTLPHTSQTSVLTTYVRPSQKPEQDTGRKPQPK